MKTGFFADNIVTHFSASFLAVRAVFKFYYFIFSLSFEFILEFIIYTLNNYNCTFPRPPLYFFFSLFLFVHVCVFMLQYIVLVCDSMLSTLYAIANPSVHHTVDQLKTVEVWIMQFSPYSSPIPLVFAG